ncbi:MAG: hypothetical protein K6B45_05970, partial [Bacteroidaceae bacterium]|nr:hypothetical protein [Bacteroidaceae bacterium]
KAQLRVSVLMFNVSASAFNLTNRLQSYNKKTELQNPLTSFFFRVKGEGLEVRGERLGVRG